jgi:hypothetical protein
MIRTVVRRAAEVVARHVWKQSPVPLGRRGESFNVVNLAALTAGLDSADYYTKKMLQAKICEKDLDLLTLASSVAPSSGLILEFGVASGRTLNHLASLRPEVHGFDVFSGLPESWRAGYDAGAFARDSLPQVEKNAHLHQGLFADSLPAFLEQNPGEISLIHIDCDLYSSTRDAFNLLAPRIKRGVVIVFDEYFNYPGWRDHEYKALQELVAASGQSYRYIGVVPSHQQAAIVIE